VVVANPGTADLIGMVTVIPSQGQAKDVPFRVGPMRRIVVRLGDVTAAPFDAALVQLDGSTGGVELQINGGLGESVTPCATQASGQWYFASGSTDRDAQMLLSVFNPFPDDAIVDLNFATDTGRFTPADLQGVIVPGRGLSVVNIGEHVRRRHAVSTSLAVRSGRVVAGKIELHGPGGAPPHGATLTLGAPLAGTTWYFPDGVTAPGVDERYELYNPTDHEADVEVALLLQSGSISPFELTLAPHDRLTLDVNAESRVPRGVAHAGVVQSTNGVPIAVARVITAAPPSSRAGISETIGSPSTAEQWLFPVGAANNAQDEWLVAFNPATTTTRVSVTALVGGEPVPVEGLQGVGVPPGERVALRLGDHVSGGLLLSLRSQAPIVVERDLYRIGALGISAAFGIPGP
jgi:hypothetical protein